jgi:uncharacterized protein YcnI
VSAVVALPLHVEPQVSEAPAAARFIFAFEVEHGCEGSPTIEVAIQTPPGSFDVAPVDKPGWTATVDAADPPVVTFTGGRLADDVADTFAVELVTPDAAGTDALFPTVQVCEVGELAWIETEAGGDSPAPRVRLLPNPDPLPPPSTTTTAPTSTSTTEGLATSTTTATTGTTEAEGTDEEDGSGSTGAWLVAGAVAAAAVGLAVRAARGRRL